MFDSSSDVLLHTQPSWPQIKRRPKVQMSVTGKCPFVSSSETKGNSDKEPIKIKNFLTSRNLTDVLYLQANVSCASLPLPPSLFLSSSHHVPTLSYRPLRTNLLFSLQAEVCSGSILKPHVLGESTPKRSVGEIFELSKEFLEEYFIHTKKSVSHLI